VDIGGYYIINYYCLLYVILRLLMINHRLYLKLLYFKLNMLFQITF